MFRWREQQQYTSDYSEHNYIREIPPVAVVPGLNRLDEHHGGVGEIPPSRESNQRAVRRRIPRGKQKKDSQWDEEAHKHRVDFVVLLQEPGGVPKIRIQRVKETDKGDPQ